MARGRPSTNGIAAGRRRAPGTGSCSRSGPAGRWADGPGPGPTTSAATRHTAPAATAATFEHAASGTRSRNRRTSGPTAAAEAEKGGRPTGFDRDHHRRRNEVERTVNRLRNFRAVATATTRGPTSS
ncbi:putative transposase [Streptomyces sp. PVA_94-07]|nr:putative transposase [Streptomyces sp. PVA_94-07]